MAELGKMHHADEVKTLEFLRDAFDSRKMPEVLVLSGPLSEDERIDIRSFEGKHWPSVSCEQLVEHGDAVFWFSPEAFCYYLPGILSAGLRERRPDLLVYDAIIDMLDRSPDPTRWDDFFLERWPLLTPRECQAVQEWVRWIAPYVASDHFANTVPRMLETLELLREGVTAIKSPRRVP